MARSEKTSSRFVLAGLLAPAAGALWAGLFFSVLMAASAEGYQSPPTFALMATFSAIYAALIALFFTWTIGLAWHVIACANGWHSATAYIAFGAGAGVMGAVLIYFLSNASWTPATLLGVLWLGSTAAVIAAVGWLIRRPDRDAPANPPTSTP